MLPPSRVVVLDGDLDRRLPELQSAESLTFTGMSAHGRLSRPAPVGTQLVGFLRRLPALRHVVLDRAGIDDSAAPALGAWLADRRIAGLQIRLAPLTDRGLRALLAHPLPHLQALRLFGCSLGRRGSFVLSRARLDALTELDLGMNPGLEASDLLRLPTLGILSRLSLRGVRVDPGVMVPLLASLGPVRSLDLSATGLGAAGLAALLASRAAHTLVRLDLAQCQLRGSELGVFEGPQLPRLAALNLSNSRMGTVGAQHLSRAVLPALRRLELDFCGLDEDGTHAMLGLRMPLLRRLSMRNSAIEGEDLERLDAPLLEVLNLGAAGIGDRGAQRIAWLPRLQQLTLTSCAIGERGVDALAQSSAPFRALRLDDNPLGPKGARGLAGRAWRTLDTLDLSSCDLGDSSALELARLQAPLLYRLDVGHNRIGDRGAAVLRAAYRSRVVGLDWQRRASPAEAGSTGTSTRR